MNKCFDSEKYIKLQSKKIKERINDFDKLYIEFGGKLVDDYHAARVLPGFKPDIKIQLLQELKNNVEVLLCINADDIEKNKIRSDRVISYTDEIVRLIEFFRTKKIAINNVVITLYKNQPSVKQFVERLNNYNVKTYIHTPTKGYPTDVDTIVSEEGYGANPYIETTKKIVVVSAPGACSGKLATSLSQLYHEYKRGVKAGYAKFETFPVWNLSIKHPINIAYEAATADINDKNMIDNYHLEKYGVMAVNYNRDIQMFPVLSDILYKITGKNVYYSPTDMGVNVIKDCIVDDELARKSAKEEIIRRYYKSLVDYKKGLVNCNTPKTIKMLLNELGISEKDRVVAIKAMEKKKLSGYQSAAIEINGEYITGRQTDILSPISSTIINVMKYLTKIPDEVNLLSPTVLEPILEIKQKISNFKELNLKLDEVLLALSICSVTNPIVKEALDKLTLLNGTEMHVTYIIPDSEMVILNNLGINVTCDAEHNIEN